MALALSPLLVLYAAWQVFRWPGAERTLVGDLFFYPIGVAAVAAAIGAARRCRQHPRLRSAWRAIAVASAAYLAGDVARYDDAAALVARRQGK